VKGYVGFWAEVEKMKRGGLPTAEEIAAKVEEQVNNLPQTEEERRQYLAREHPLEEYF